MEKHLQRGFVTNIDIKRYEHNVELGEFVQGDIKSSYLGFNIKNGNRPYDLTDCEVIYQIKKPDGTKVSSIGEISMPTRGYVECAIGGQALLIDGVCELELSILKNGAKLTSHKVRYMVNPSLFETIGVSQDEITVLSQLMDRVHEYSEMVRTEEEKRNNSENSRIENEKQRELAETDRDTRFDKMVNDLEELKPTFKGEKGDKGDKGDTGSDGKSIEFTWRGTELGIRQTGTSEYLYTDLKGDKGDCESIDLNNFYNKQEADNKFIDEEELNRKGYLTEHQDISGKVDKVEGKQLSTEDYTTLEKAKLSNVEEGANNYTHPNTHVAKMIEQDFNHRFVTDEEKNKWNSKVDSNQLHNHSNKNTLDKITEPKIISWDNKSDFSGSYNDLTNIPTNFTPAAHRHNATEIDNLPNGGNVDLTNYYNKSQTDEQINNTAINVLDSLIVKLENMFNSDQVEPPPVIPEEVECTEIRIEPSSLTIDKLNHNYTLTAITVPEGVTESITWSCDVGGTILHVADNGDKTATVIAFKDTTANVTVTCGSCTYTCAVTVKTVVEPENCTDIKIEPSPLTMSELMKEYTLTAITVPENVIEPIEWSCDAGATSISVIDNKNGTATVQAYRDLTANVTVTCGSCSYTTQIIVDTKNILTTSLNFNQSKLVFNNNGDEYSQNITAEVFPRTSTQEIVWTVIEGDESMVRIEPMTNGAKVIPLKVGECKIQGQSGRYKDVCEIVNVQHTETSLLDNPTIKIENHKAVLEQNGYVERFDLNYEPNTGHPQYLSSKEIIGDDGVTYYLSLLKTGSSRFRIDGMVPDSGGWKSILIKGDDSIYPFALSPFPKVNNFNFSYTVANKNDSVFKDLFDLTLSTINTSFEALNITESPDSINTMEMNDYSDSWFGVLESYPNYFQIKLNKERMTRGYGAYEEYKNRWLGTSVHELGHSLGIQDNPRHSPSLYDYGANPDKRWFMQPNDLDVIEYYYKNSWGVDITLTQEEITERLKNSPVVINDTPKDFYDICFDFGTFNEDELLEVSDVILTGELEFLRKENINIGNDMVLPYNIYKIKADTLEKGELVNNELKIHDSIDIEIEKGTKYKMYLVQYEGCPCSLVNIEQGICRL